MAIPPEARLPCRAWAPQQVTQDREHDEDGDGFTQQLAAMYCDGHRARRRVEARIWRYGWRRRGEYEGMSTAERGA